MQKYQSLVFLLELPVPVFYSEIIRIRSQVNLQRAFNRNTIDTGPACDVSSTFQRVLRNVKARFDKQKYGPDSAKTGSATGNSSKHEPVNFWLHEVKK